MVWYRHRGAGRWRLEAATRAPGAVKFGAPRPISAFVRRPCCTAVSVAIGERGDAVATWTSTARPAVWAALRPAGRAFRAPQRLAADPAGTLARRRGRERRSSADLQHPARPAARRRRAAAAPRAARPRLRSRRARQPARGRHDRRRGRHRRPAACSSRGATGCGAPPSISPRPRPARRSPRRPSSAPRGLRRLRARRRRQRARGGLLVAAGPDRGSARAGVRSDAPGARGALRRPDRARPAVAHRRAGPRAARARAAARSSRGTARATAARRSAAPRCWSRACPNAILAPPTPSRGEDPMAVDRELGAGSWSYFGDPRAISHDGDTFTGWISTTGNVWVARYSAEGKLSKRVIFKGLGRDDHNNPSLVFRHDGHIMVFFSPHSGHHLPPPGIPSLMRYMVSLNPYSINGFGKVHTVHTNVPGGLGYTYPNPMQLRTSCGSSGAAARWNPTFSYTEDGIHWVPARELVYFGHAQRPYTKYVTDGNQRIHGIFTDGHPENWKNSLHYARYENQAPVRDERAQARRRSRTSRCTPPSSTTSTTTQTAAGAPGATTSRSRPTAGRASSTRAGSTTATPSTTPTTTARSGSAARSSRPAPAARPSTRAERRSTTRTRASSTCRARSGAGTRSSSGSRPTRGAPGRTASSPRPRRLRHPPGHAARPGQAANRILYVGATSAPSASPTTRRASTRSTSRPRQALLASSSCRRSWAASSISLWRHSAAR